MQCPLDRFDLLARALHARPGEPGSRRQQPPGAGEADHRDRVGEPGSRRADGVEHESEGIEVDDAAVQAKIEELAAADAKSRDLVLLNSQLMAEVAQLHAAARVILGAAVTFNNMDN